LWIKQRNVVKIVTDNALDNMATTYMASFNRPNILWTSYAEHTINLMLADIKKD